MPHLSVVSPIFNEEQCLGELVRRLSEALQQITDDYEILLVDDGSRDRSWAMICDLHASDSRVKGLRFSRNFGHHRAITAGLDHSTGDWVVVMDSDLQDPPEAIPALYARAREGFDVVLAKRMNKQHGLVKRLASRAFYGVLTYLSGVPYDDQVGVFRILSRRAVVALCSLRESARFFLGLVEWIGFPRTSIEVAHGERYAGQTKYSLHKQFALAFDAILSFSDKPLKLTVYLGVAFACAGLVHASTIVVLALLGQIAVMGYASLMSAILVVGGVTIVSVGLVGLYVGNIFEQVKGRPLYIVADSSDPARTAATAVGTSNGVHP